MSLGLIFHCDTISRPREINVGMHFCDFSFRNCHFRLKLRAAQCEVE